MRYVILLLIFIFLSPLGFCLDYEIDNIYGEYLIAGTKNNISMDLKDASLIEVLKALSEQSGLNFVSTDAVRDRRITLYFDNVPLKDAMNIIFEANGLSYDYFPKAKIFVVKEMGKPDVELKTKVYTLKYVRLSSSRFQQEVDNLLASEEEGGGSDSGSAESEDIKSVVEGVLSDNGRVAEDIYTNSLVVVDIPSQFPIIDKVISQLDRPQPKVMIEVEMLDVSKSLIDQLGIDYANGITFTFTGGSYSTSFPFSKDFWRAHSAGSEDGVAYEATPSTMNLNSLTAMLKFFSKDTSTRFLARPRILTLSNETAEVNLTTNAAVGVTTTTTEEGTTQEVERMDIGTKLRVTPYVNLITREITMVVKVYNREAKDSGLSVAGLTTGNLKDPEERGTKSVVRLKDGETLLIGGLIRKEETNTLEKVPFLGDLPLVGSMFRYKNKNNDERELLVFLTPHIVYDSGGAISLSKLDKPREQNFYSRHNTISKALDSFSKR